MGAVVREWEGGVTAKDWVQTARCVTWGALVLTRPSESRRTGVLGNMVESNGI